jgi:hypothetical protein
MVPAQRSLIFSFERFARRNYSKSVGSKWEELKVIKASQVREISQTGQMLARAVQQAHRSALLWKNRKAFDDDQAADRSRT